MAKIRFKYIELNNTEDLKHGLVLTKENGNYKWVQGAYVKDPTDPEHYVPAQAAVGTFDENGKLDPKSITGYMVYDPEETNK